MVWGMNHPPGSNGFYLPGEFEGAVPVASDGWRTRLAEHFQHEMTPGERAIFEDENGAGAHWYACHAVNKFSLRREFFGTHRDGSVSEILPHEIPEFFWSSGNCAKLASMALFAGPVLTVDEALKDFIEWLEPGVHKFFPIEVRKARAKPPVHSRYLMVVEQRIDSFSETLSDKASFEKGPHIHGIRHRETPRLMRRLAFRKADIEGAHLWHEPQMSSFLLCISDRLQAEIADAGLRIPRHYPMMEV